MALKLNESKIINMSDVKKSTPETNERVNITQRIFSPFVHIFTIFNSIYRWLKLIRILSSKWFYSQTIEQAVRKSQ